MVTLRITSERKRAWVYVENAAIKHSNLAAGREAAWLEVYLPSMQAPLNCCFIIIVTNTRVKNVFFDDSRTYLPTVHKTVHPQTLLTPHTDFER